MGDYNAEVTETSMQEFCESYFSENMVKKTTFQKSCKCIDQITNKPGMSQNAKAFETGLSDFRKLVVSIVVIKKDRHA